jgi:cytochrome b
VEAQTTGSNPRAQSTLRATRLSAPVLIWDAPTRVFHWALALSFFTALATGESDRLRDVHVCFGYIALGLAVFRVIWGIVGTRYARFSSFAFSPRVVTTYTFDLFAGRASRHIGHNPPGSWAIYLMLALVFVICITGIVVLGAEEAQGILRGVAERPIGEFIKEIHEATSWIMFALVVTHLIGVVVESLAHRENLAAAMLTGRKRTSGNDEITSSHRTVAALMVIAILATAAWQLRWRGMSVAGVHHLPFVGRALPDNETWRTTCGACHVPYHPTLLPARSWHLILDRVNDHFGQDLGIDPQVVRAIRAFMVANSAETGETEAAYRINRSIPLDDTPRRITETGYWVEKHQHIEAAYWSHEKVGRRNNCAGCHLDAHEGT